ncbi:MAG: division/cell wall cluster transcriptional repressor MraZ [Acidimicrobiales bacterium]
MFLGEHTHALDDKHRVILPVKFREPLAGAFITSEIDGCLGLWPAEEFSLRAAEMKERAKGGEEDRNVARFFFAYAREASPDKQGRVALPLHLREFAHLDKDVVINGAWDHVEIWDAAVWQQKKQAGERALAGS